MTDLVDFKVDLETPRPNPFNNTQVLLGDSPRTAFTKHNDMIDALHQLVRHIGPLAPSPTSPWMLWLDTSMNPPVARQRNQANTAWDLATGVTVLPSGNIGFGTSAPTAKIHVSGAGGSIPTVLVENTVTGAGNFASMNFKTPAEQYAIGTEGNGRFYIFNSTQAKDQFSLGGGVNSFVALSALGTGVIGLYTNNLLQVQLDAIGNLLLKGNTGGAIGYGTGAGGTVAQLTNKTTAVTLNRASGRITTHAAALAGGSVATFTLNNTAISGDDCVVVTVKAGNATPGSYQVWTEATLNGSCKVCLRNASADSLSEAVSLSFVVIRGATA